MTRGEGCVLWDVSGRRFLDMTAGVAVCVLGHGDVGGTRPVPQRCPHSERGHEPHPGRALVLEQPNGLVHDLRVTSHQ